VPYVCVLFHPQGFRRLRHSLNSSFGVLLMIGMHKEMRLQLLHSAICSRCHLVNICTYKYNLPINIGHHPSLSNISVSALFSTTSPAPFHLATSSAVKEYSVAPLRLRKQTWGRCREISAPQCAVNLLRVYACS
jgi:hypothetical protein